MIPNLGYQGTQNFNPQMGQQLLKNSNSNTDELLLRVTEMMKNQFGLKPKGQTFSYKHPYLEWYDLVALPTNYRLPEFAKFTGQDSTSTIEHASWYLTQLDEASLKKLIEFVSSLCPCQDQLSPDFHRYQLIQLPIGLTWRRNFIHISILGQEKGKTQI